MTTDNKSQEIKINNKKVFTADGIQAVLSFDDDFLSLETINGRLSIEGKELKIVDLSKENGKITVVGNIGGVFFEGDKKKKGLFG